MNSKNAGGKPASRVVPLESGPVDAPAPVAVGFALLEMPPLLRTLVSEASLAAPAPESLIAAAVLGFISASLGSRLKLESSSGRRTGANLYILGFAESGTGKSSAFGLVGAPFNAENSRRIKEWEQEERPKRRAKAEIARADLDRAKKLRKEATTTEQLDESERSITDAQQRYDQACAALDFEPALNLGQATAEGLALALSRSNGEANAILSADARDVLGNILGRYSQGKFTDEHFLVQAFSGDPFAKTRAGSARISLECPTLSLCLLVQPDMWRRLTETSAMEESGFLPRCLIFDSKAPPARPTHHKLSEAVKTQWQALVLQLLKTFRDAGHDMLVTMSPEAETAFDELIHEAADAQMPGGQWADIRSFAARLAENATRLSLVLHAAIYSDKAPSCPLSEDTARSGIGLARWFFSQAVELIAPLRQSRREARLNRLVEVFTTRRTREMTVRKLGDSGYGRDELAALAREFPTRLRIDSTKPGPKGGRPSDVVKIAPFDD